MKRGKSEMLRRYKDMKLRSPVNKNDEQYTLVKGNITLCSLSFHQFQYFQAVTFDKKCCFIHFQTDRKEK